MISKVFIVLLMLYNVKQIVSKIPCGCPENMTRRGDITKRDIEQMLTRRDEASGTPITFMDDMALTSYDMMKFHGLTNSKFRNAVKRDKRWPNGQVDYVFNGGVESIRRKIRNAINLLSRFTNGCIKFKENKTPPKGIAYVDINIRKNGGCWSRVGVEEKGKPQTLSMGDGCYNPKTIMHEFTHTLGFYHEMSRPDRAKYIKVMPDNIRSGGGCMNYELCKDCDTYLDLDVDSMMMYNSRSFSCNGNWTMMTNQCNFIHQAKKPSVMDIKKIMLYYECKQEPNIALIEEPRNWADDNSECDSSAAKRNYCRYDKFTREYCFKSCNDVGQLYVRPKPKDNCEAYHKKPEIKDKFSQCAGWVKQGYCDQARYRDYYCKLSCSKL